MKKYIIRNADGSEQRFIRAKYNSRKEAEEALLIYLCDHNENCDDSSYLSPFDFTVEEVDVKDVNETITNFESARKALGLESNVDFELLGCFDKFDDIVQLISDINPKHVKTLIALNELFTIAEAWNKEDGFVPDFSDNEQDKWFPFFKYNKDATGLVFAYSGSAWSCMLTDEYVVIVGSRLCFKSSERAAQFGKQFAELYNKVFL